MQTCPNDWLIQYILKLSDILENIPAPKLWCHVFSKTREWKGSFRQDSARESKSSSCMNFEAERCHIAGGGLAIVTLRSGLHNWISPAISGETREAFPHFDSYCKQRGRNDSFYFLSR